MSTITETLRRLITVVLDGISIHLEIAQPNLSIDFFAFRAYLAPDAHISMFYQF